METEKQNQPGLTKESKRIKARNEAAAKRHEAGLELALVNSVKAITQQVQQWADEAARAEAEGIVVEEPRLEVGWQGWRSCTLFSARPYFRHVTYFDEMIKAGKYANMEQALADARVVLDMACQFETSGTAGDSFENTLIRLYGLNSDEFKSVEPESLYLLFYRCWRVGEATSKHDVKRALYKAATQGSLDAQKTILTSTGELSLESASAGSGEVYLLVDQEDMKA